MIAAIFRECIRTTALVVMLLYVGCGPSASGVFPRKVDQRLAEAAARGDVSAIDALIKEGADINAKGEKGMTPVQFAMDKENKIGFEHLLKRGADPNLPNAWGECVVNYAAKDWQDSEWLKTSMKYGGDPNVKLDKPSSIGIIRGETPLFDAVGASSVSNMKILLEYGGDINVSSDNGFTPVIVASRGRDPVMTKWLLEHGADWRAHNKRGLGLAEAEIRHEYDASEFPEAAAAHQWILNFLQQKGVDLKAAEDRSRAIYGKNFRPFENQ